MPWWSTHGSNSKPEPERVTMDGGHAASGRAWPALGHHWRAERSLPLQVVGAESAYDCGTIPCDAIEADRSEQPALACSGERPRYTLSYCMGCHSLQYSRYILGSRGTSGSPRTCTRPTWCSIPTIKLGSLMAIHAMDKGERQGVVWGDAARSDPGIPGAPAGVAVHLSAGFLPG